MCLDKGGNSTGVIESVKRRTFACCIVTTDTFLPLAQCAPNNRSRVGVTKSVWCFESTSRDIATPVTNLPKYLQ